ncbi:nucleoside diphosphate kinase 6-like [Mytilus galloprovincialis]|uniref:nucleoside diphosphate kinase 6-like n=1 Tax=Mytilus galloprovincialis TaxID=29158 RepID=UPI003F7C79D8
MPNCLLKPLQLTLAIFKPDIVSRPHIVQQIKQMIRDDGFFFIKSTTCYLPRSKAEEFYKEHEGRFFHNRLVTFISSGHVSAHILAKHDAIKCWRKLMGPTKVLKTVHEDPNSVRGKFGSTDTRNATHGSDSDESARREINFFFPNFNIEEWHRTEEQYFREGKVKFCEDKEIHVIIAENEHKLGHE